MSLTLEFWYYTETNLADEPVLVRSESELERVLADLALQGAQPHPTQVIAQELPTFGPADLPDRMFKLDIAPGCGLGALHFVGPDPDSDTGEVGSWASRAEDKVANPPVLYIDKDNETLFPPDAAITFSLIEKALDEFRQTGLRPTCVRWQPTGGIY